MTNLTFKILGEHLTSGQLTPGEEIGIKIDQTLTQDATGTMAYLQFEALKVPRVRTELSVSFVDHNMLQQGFENADDHRYLQSVAAKFGIYFSKPGNGICHQVYLERFGVPGKTLLGSDSHTPTGGALGALAIGAGGLDVAVAMGGGSFFLTCPRVTEVRLSGKLREWVTAKDIILKVLEILTTKGNVNTVLEYTGSGVKNLSVPERATITNMGAEVGVTTSIFPSDAQTKRFLISQNRGQVFCEVKADKNAEYDSKIEINLDKLEPLFAAPHSPDHIVTVKKTRGLKIQQVLIGSCVNSSYRDLMTVSKILKGRRVHRDVTFGVAAGSRQVLQMITEQGALADLVASGARILESACGFCIGAGQAPATGSVSVRTGNRNFLGRCGTKDAGVYLASPVVAAACALAGEVVDPRQFFGHGEFKTKFPRISLPSKIKINDDHIIAPVKKAGKILRGPNIGAPPKNDLSPQCLSGVVGIKVGDKITTDHIMPAGERMKYRSNVPKYSEFVFEPLDPDFPRRCRENRDRGAITFIIGGQSYGQGSSREHAALCPMYLGVRVVLAKSIERIHSANLVNFGILPLIFKNPRDYDRLDANDELEIDEALTQVKKGHEILIRNKTKKFELAAKHSLTARQVKILAAGGLLNSTS